MRESSLRGPIRLSHLTAPTNEIRPALALPGPIRLLHELGTEFQNISRQQERRNTKGLSRKKQNYLRMKYLSVVVVIAALLRQVPAGEEGNTEKKDSVGTVIGIDLGTTYSW